MIKKIKNSNHFKEMRCKLSIDEGYSEDPIYRIISKVTEKEKGLSMMDLIQKIFNISEWERTQYIKKVLEEFRDKNKINFTRDERGNICSPFRTNK